MMGLLILIAIALPLQAEARPAPESFADLAEKRLDIATRLDPDFDKAINNLGVLYLRSGDPGRAVATYEAALEDHPAFVPILSNLASAYQRTGNRERAEEVMATLETLDHSDPLARVAAGRALYRLDRRHADEIVRAVTPALDVEGPYAAEGAAKLLREIGTPEAKRALKDHAER